MSVGKIQTIIYEQSFTIWLINYAIFLSYFSLGTVFYDCRSFILFKDMFTFLLSLATVIWFVYEGWKQDGFTL